MKPSRTLALTSALLLAILPAACGKREDPGSTRVAPPTVESAKPGAGKLELAVAATGLATFAIDAPLEKIKGKATGFRGSLVLDPKHLDGLTGHVDVDLGTLVTETFDDPKKNTLQTDHARNWLGLGSEVEAKAREENQWARFTIRSAKVQPTALASAPEAAGKRKVEATAEGDFWLHGVSVRKTVKLVALFEGPVDAPHTVSVSTVEPLRMSLREHDVKPRDVTGTFLQGALEKIGDKIVDEVKLSLELTLRPATAP